MKGHWMQRRRMLWRWRSWRDIQFNILFCALRGYTDRVNLEELTLIDHEVK